MVTKSSTDKTTSLSFFEVWPRVSATCGLETYSDLARALDITTPSIADAKKRDTFPLNWTLKLSQMYKVSLDYIVYGSVEYGERPAENNILYIDPALQLIDEAIQEAGVEINAKQKQALIDIVREELKGKTVDMLKAMKGI